MTGSPSWEDLRNALQRIAQTDDEGRPRHSQAAMHLIATDVLGWAPVDFEEVWAVDGDVGDPAGDYDQAPEVSIGEAWAEEHHNELYRRPKGQVIYRVIGADGNGYGGVKVQRSSDGGESVMSVLEFDKMVRTRRADITDEDAWKLGLSFHPDCTSMPPPWPTCDWPVCDARRGDGSIPQPSCVLALGHDGPHVS